VAEVEQAAAFCAHLILEWSGDDRGSDSLP
jgi:hypothetical protein